MMGLTRGGGYFGYGGNQFLWQFAGIFDFIQSVLVIVLLIVVIRWFWKKGSK